MSEKELKNLYFIAMIEVAGCAPESALIKPLSPIMLRFAELIAERFAELIAEASKKSVDI
jgi:hypothetical protein